MSKTILCVGGRCSTWGKSWKKHIYYADISDGDVCARCGMNREEQWNEDKFSGLVTGEYKKPTLKLLSYDPEKHRGEQ